MKMDHDVGASTVQRGIRILGFLLFYAAILGFGHAAGEFLDLSLITKPAEDGRSLSLYLAICLGLALYMFLMALPFVPGMEVSIALLMAFGPTIAPALYLATVAALACAYAMGNRLPTACIERLFSALGFNKAEQFVRALAPLMPDQKLQKLIERAPLRLIPFLLKYRYVAVMVALNLPGNTIIGGGGGIALLAGMSGIFSFRHFLTAVALAVMPVPVAIILFGQ